MEIKILNQWTIHYMMRSSKTHFTPLSAKTNTKVNIKSVFPQRITTKLIMQNKIKPDHSILFRLS